MNQAPPTIPGEIPQEPAPAVIPYRNPAALIGYYAAVASLIPFIGLAAGPTAVGLGVAGLRKVRKEPGVRGTAHAIVAIVLGGLTSLLNWGLAVLVLFVTRAAP